VTECVNCLDHDKCKWLKTKDGQRIYPTKFVFHPDRFVESSIFKIPEMRASSPLCVERENDPETEFKAAVEHHKLKGLTFKLLWSGRER
jgi:hypothetical protein